MDLPLVSTYRVPYADTDQMDVIYYANYLELFERSRNEMLRGMGITYRELEAWGFVLPVLESYVKYHAPGRYDDLLELHAACTEYRGVRLKVSCEVRRDGQLLAEGYTIHAFVDKKLRPVRPTTEVLNRLGLLPNA